jgi:glycosyltransferase 2 family protein
MRALKLAIRLVVSLAISALFVWLSLRHVDLRAVGRTIASASPARMALYVLILLLIHLVRTVRWGILLEPLGHVSFKRLNSASAVGFMLLMALPLRLGEFARPLLIARPPPGGGARLSRSGAMASIVVERIVDGLAVGMLGVLALNALGAQVRGEYAVPARRAALLVTIGFGVLCVAVVSAFFLRERTLRVTNTALRPFSPRLAARAVSVVDSFISALHLGSGTKSIAFFALTGVYWGLNAFGLWLLAPAFGLSLSGLMVCTVLAMQVVGVMIPAGPGMIGTFQLFTQIGVSLFVPGAFANGSPVAARAAGYSNTVWMLTFGTQTALGVLFMMLGHVSLRGLFGTAAPDDPAPVTVSAASS